MLEQNKTISIILVCVSALLMVALTMLVVLLKGDLLGLFILYWITWIGLVLGVFRPFDGKLPKLQIGKHRPTGKFWREPIRWPDPEGWHMLAEALITLLATILTICIYALSELDLSDALTAICSVIAVLSGVALLVVCIVGNMKILKHYGQFPDKH